MISRVHNMTFDTVALLAQEEDGWGRLIYLLLFLVLPMLNKFGEKIRNWAAAKEEQKQTAQASPSETPKGAQAAPPIVLQGEQRGAPPKIPVPVARAPRTVDHRAHQPTPVKARRVYPKQTRAKAARPPAPDARAQRMAAARHLAKEPQSSSPPQEHGKQRDHPALLLGRLDPQSLRSVVVLSEILQPPLALREGWPDAS